MKCFTTKSFFISILSILPMVVGIASITLNSSTLFSTELKTAQAWTCPAEGMSSCSRWYEVYEVKNAAACEYLSITENCGRWYSADVVFTPPRSKRESVKTSHKSPRL